MLIPPYPAWFCYVERCDVPCAPLSYTPMGVYAFRNQRKQLGFRAAVALPLFTEQKRLFLCETPGQVA
jgi:hypothetical protein